MKKSSGIETKFLQKLKFRRQFLIGPSKYSPNEYWDIQKLNHNLFLSIHKDLGFFTKAKKSLRITLIGLAVDCTSPYKTGNEIVTTLLDCFNDIHSVIEASKPLAGRWALVCQDAHDTFIFTDPCGMRQVYYSTGKNRWCASQPTLVNQVEDLEMTSNKSILTHRNSTDFKNSESAWFGDKTLYNNCLHLMPNHYLDVKKCSQVRFFPKDSIPAANNIDKVCTEAATYYKNIMNGLEHQFNLEIGLSAGYDSRLLLAASVDISDSVLFITDIVGNLKRYHDDIYIPKNLARKLKLNFNTSKIDVILPPWFVELLSENVLEARTSPVLPKIKTIYQKLLDEKSDTVLLGGNVTELVRVQEIRLKKESSYYDKNSSDKLKHIYNYNNKNEFLENEIYTWLNSFDISLIQEATIHDIYYWEQRMGNWGALFPAEFDIAAETVSPFNCRLLLETCLKVPRSQRMAPGYTFFYEMISKLWPEVLSEPINPGPKGLGLFKKTLRENLPSVIVNSLRKIKG